MTLLVDTSVWSLAFRRDSPPDLPAVRTLRRALAGDEIVLTTGLIVQELLQGALPGAGRDALVQRLGALPVIEPTIDDHVAAADLRNDCRRAGVQLGTIDALIAALCVRHDVALLSTDRDFEHAAPHLPGLRLRRPADG